MPGKYDLETLESLFSTGMVPKRRGEGGGSFVSPDVFGERQPEQAGPHMTLPSTTIEVEPKMGREQMRAELMESPFLAKLSELGEGYKQDVQQPYEVSGEYGGEYPGQRLTEKMTGEEYFAPAYGPSAGERVRLDEGTPMGELQSFLAGPPPAPAADQMQARTFEPSGTPEEYDALMRARARR